MYASIYRFTGVQSAEADVLRAARQLAAALSRRSGFVSYVLLEAEDQVGIAVTMFETQADLAAANQFAEGWVAEQLPGWRATPPQIASSEVIVQHGL